MSRRHALPVALAGAAALAAAATARAARAHDRLGGEVRRALADTTHARVGDIGAVRRLRILPLVDRRTSRPGLVGEPGVAYLVEADGERLLFDTGLNLLRRRRSPLERNAEALGVDLAGVPAVVLSHAHEDHVGGAAAVRDGSFTFGGQGLEATGLVAFAPVERVHRRAEVRVTTRTTVVAPGVALLPPLPAALFWDREPVLEQALVVNVRDVGLVLVAGCGHPGVPAMVDLVAEVLDVPLHGVVGGLHLPVRPGPGHLVQALSGSPRPPWRPLGDADVDVAIARLRAAGTGLVAVSGHDSTSRAMALFGAAFGAGFGEVRVGAEIVVGA